MPILQSKLDEAISETGLTLNCAVIIVNYKHDDEDYLGFAFSPPESQPSDVVQMFYEVTTNFIDESEAHLH